MIYILPPSSPSGFYIYMKSALAWPFETSRTYVHLRWCHTLHYTSVPNLTSLTGSHILHVAKYLHNLVTTDSVFFVTGVTIAGHLHPWLKETNSYDATLFTVTYICIIHDCLLKHNFTPSRKWAMLKVERPDKIQWEMIYLFSLSLVPLDPSSTFGLLLKAA